MRKEIAKEIKRIMIEKKIKLTDLHTSIVKSEEVISLPTLRSVVHGSGNYSFDALVIVMNSLGAKELVLNIYNSKSTIKLIN